MKKVNQIEIKIKDISFIPGWNTLLSLPLFVEEKLDPVSCIFFDTNRQGLWQEFFQRLCKDIHSCTTQFVR